MIIFLKNKECEQEQTQDSNDEDDKGEETVEDKISSTVRYLVKQKLLEEFEETAGTYYEEELERYVN